MICEQIKCGGDRNFAYIIGDEGSRDAVLIDPAYGVQDILARVNELGLKITHVINTHSHGDHSGGNAEVCAETGAQVAAYSGGDLDLKDGDTLKVGSIDLFVIHTPGHTPDSICILAEDKLITGDTLFVGKVGGTGFGQDAEDEYYSIHNKLMCLDDGIEVLPGHDVGVRPVSTIGDEKKENPFVLRPDLESFIELKRNLAQYKEEHGIA